MGLASRGECSYLCISRTSGESGSGNHYGKAHSKIDFITSFRRKVAANDPT
jgi:hypothetical protein